LFLILVAFAMVDLGKRMVRRQAPPAAAPADGPEAQLVRERELAEQILLRRLEEERKLNDEKMQFQARLAEYEKWAALAQLALGAGHEISNPLLGILSHLELELKTAHDPEQRAEVESCIAAVKRISAIVRGLMDYARPSRPIIGSVNLHRLTADTVAFLEKQPLLHGKQVRNKVPADLPPIRGDANQLSQVLVNLVLNSADATPEGGSITISASAPDPEGIELRVEDTGCGIPRDLLPRVFEPFFTTKRGRGTGLGLSISQSYVRSQNGDIHIASTVNEGTTVTIRLPAGAPVDFEPECVGKP
jgi:signal transduction histidine kinase